MICNSLKICLIQLLVLNISAHEITNRIVGGQNALQGQFPYQVSWCVGHLFYCQIFCGGSIYNENTIITAAHCCDGMNHFMAQHGITWKDVRIIAGELNILQISGFEQSRKVQSYVIHPSYNSGSFQHDICLLTLDSPLRFNPFVNRIPLDTQGPVPGTKCQVSGWGDQKDHGGSYPVNLQWTEVSIRLEKDCHRAYNNPYYGYNSSVMLCASAPVSVHH